MLKRIVAPAVLCAALLGGLASAAPAGAATPTPSVASSPAHGASGPLRKWLSAHRPQIRRAVLAVSSKSIGVSRPALAADLRSGQSLAGIAAAHGVATRSVVAALVKAADARVDTAVAHHTLTTTQAATIKTKLNALVAKLVNHHFHQKDGSVAPPGQT